ncbi:MAG: hypothetical protein ACD_80C00151G0011 [uncultured bacterium (gcode 4)]|uniref:Glycosyl transferase family 1 domain-containing protein n=1 Tax=uncultured bacterium (gcode 4) TaxID=1234023 RepID=K1XHR9_9BACT|nr:MAG: hypothetical protein ACD_80C00151G0011 [uncultured bacterium (gcode 4)]
MKKVLVLPEVYSDVNIWWSLSIVKKMYDLDRYHFDFIEKKWNVTYWKTAVNWIGNIWDTLLMKIVRFVVKKVTSLPISLYSIYLVFFNLKKIRKYKITKYEYIISHDLIMSFAIIFFYKNIKVINVYHWQWSLYYEHTKLLGYKKSFILKSILNGIENYVYKHAYKIWFPSNWACEALLQTHPGIKKIIDNRKDQIKILYNSVDIKTETKHNINIESNLISDWFNFVSIWAINHAKWIDRIVPFLKSLKNHWIKFKWILIWREWDCSNILKKSITTLGLNDDVFLYEQWIPKTEIYWLLSKTDFYIMFQRYSIFDLSTLEAMYLWNVPVLSNVWGNKEVIFDNNWLLLDEDSLHNSASFLDFIKQNKIEDLRQKNKEIVKKHFFDDNFIKWYVDLF